MKRFVALACSVVILATAFSGCSFKNSDSTKPTEATTSTSSKPKTEIADKEKARLGTLKDFLKYRSLTFDEKVLRFYFDNAQMEYVGFKIADTAEVESIPAGDTVENVMYKSENGLTAYVSVWNSGNGTADYKKCKYNKIRVVKGEAKDVAVHLPDKISLDSNVEAIKKTYGEPLEETTADDGVSTVLLYSGESEQKTEKYSISITVGDSGIEEFTVELLPVV